MSRKLLKKKTKKYFIIFKFKWEFRVIYLFFYSQVYLNKISINTHKYAKNLTVKYMYNVYRS